MAKACYRAQVCTLASAHPLPLRPATRGLASSHSSLATAVQTRAKGSAAVLEPAEANAARVLDTELQDEAETSYIAVRPA